MTHVLPSALLRAIEELGILPGVGVRTAERYAYFLLKTDSHRSDKLTAAIAALKTDVKSCPVTFALMDSDQTVSPLYTDSSRDKKTIAVVEEPLDIVALERTKQFYGTYHVLGGVISPIDGVGPEQLHVPQLLERIKTDAVTEVILATNASVEGESTALFLQRHIEHINTSLDTPVQITRLARGLPVGVDLEYADQVTLSHALSNRKNFS